MTQAKIGFIGGGNMASSLIGGLISDGYPPALLHASDPGEDKRNKLKTLFDIHTQKSNTDLVNAVDIIVLAVKPQKLELVCSGIKNAIENSNKLVISIAAGINTTSIGAWLGKSTPIIRAMPNTPALIGCGASALFANDRVNEIQKEQAESILRAVGVTTWVLSEEHIDIVTALSGSGPAYFFYFMEQLQNTAMNLGLPEDTAKLLTLQTALGAAKMALESNMDLQTLRKGVTSPGGTTERALSIFQAENFSACIEKAVTGATDRAKELSELFGNH